MVNLRAIVQPVENRNDGSILQWTIDGGFIPLHYYWAWDVYDDDQKPHLIEGKEIPASPVASGLSLGRRAAVRAARRRVKQAIAMTKRIEGGGVIEVKP